jgi:hypothetical protein
MRNELIARRFSIELDNLSVNNESEFDNFIYINELNNIKINRVKRILFDLKSVRILADNSIIVDFSQCDYLSIVVETVDKSETIWQIRPEVKSLEGFGRD